MKNYLPYHTQRGDCMSLYIWKCGCRDCGNTFEYIDSYPIIECPKCGSMDLENEFKGREYD